MGNHAYFDHTSYSFPPTSYSETVSSSPEVAALIQTDAIDQWAFSLPLNQSLTSTSLDHSHQSQPAIPTTDKTPRCWDHGCNGKTFSSYGNYLRHMRERTRRHRVRCDACGAEFSRKSNKTKHIAFGNCRPTMTYAALGGPGNTTPSMSGFIISPNEDRFGERLPKRRRSQSYISSPSRESSTTQLPSAIPDEMAYLSSSLPATMPSSMSMLQALPTAAVPPQPSHHQEQHQPFTTLPEEQFSAMKNLVTSAMGDSSMNLTAPATTTTIGDWSGGCLQGLGGSNDAAAATANALRDWNFGFFDYDPRQQQQQQQQVNSNGGSFDPTASGLQQQHHQQQQFSFMGHNRPGRQHQ